jgi:predicted nucleotidyltransferase
MSADRENDRPAGEPRYSYEEIKKTACPIARDRGAIRLSLYGPYARGEAASESGIDFLPAADSAWGYVRLAGPHIGLEEALGMEIDPRTMGCFSEETPKETAKDAIVICGSGQEP